MNRFGNSWKKLLTPKQKQTHQASSTMEMWQVSLGFSTSVMRTCCLPLASFTYGKPLSTRAVTTHHRNRTRDTPCLFRVSFTDKTISQVLETEKRRLHGVKCETKLREACVVQFLSCRSHVSHECLVFGPGAIVNGNVASVIDLFFFPLVYFFPHNGGDVSVQNCARLPKRCPLWYTCDLTVDPQRSSGRYAPPYVNPPL